MAAKTEIAKANSESINMARGIALSLAALSIALAALCLALLSFTSNQTRPNDPFFDKAVPIALVILGTVFILTAALSIDWVIDRFQDDDWKAIVGSHADPHSYDQFFVRLGLFNYGYFMMCICIAGLSFVILLQGLYELASPDTSLFKTSFVLSVLWSVYIIFQMMTLKFGKIGFALMAFGVIIGSVLFTVLG